MPNKQNTSLFPRASQFFLIGLYAWFCWLMLQITVQYIPYGTDIAFLRIKQSALSYAYYLPVFYVHVYSSMFVLLAGFTQFSRTFRVKYPTAHRRLGYVYVFTVLLFSGPSGLIMGLHANGGFWSQLAFCLLAVLWILFTVLALRSAWQRDWLVHRDWMIRSFALALSAITLRAWKYVIVAIFMPRPMDVYRLVAWLGWVVNLLVAEWIIIRLRRRF